MTARLALPALCLSLFLAGANAQDPKPAPPAQTPPAAAAQPKPAAGDEAKPPAREPPPDQKAYRDATADSGKCTEAHQAARTASERPEAAARSKENVPPGEEPTKRCTEGRGSGVGTVGRCKLKVGKGAAAKRRLAEAYGGNTDNV